jgi:hypothetical protein
VDVNLVDGTIYRAVYYTSTPFTGKTFQIILKNSKKITAASASSGTPLSPTSTSNAGTTLILPFEQIKFMTALKSKFLSTSQGKELDTDAMLSRRSNIADLDGRDLQSIDSSWLTPETNAQLDARHTIGGWNQFEANKKLYNFRDTYDENIYTKRLDRSQLTREQLEKADSLAHQIENSSTTNFHLREERGQVSTGEEENIDEEDRYSGVLRQQSPGGGTRSGKAPKNASPSGAWRRVNVPISNQPPGIATPPPSGPPPAAAAADSPDPPTVPVGSSAWGTKPTYAAAANKAAAQVNTKSAKSDPALPPGFGAPSTDGGYFKSNIDSSNIEPTLSFYGNSDAGKETKPQPAVKVASNLPPSESSDEVKTDSAKTTPAAQAPPGPEAPPVVSTKTPSSPADVLKAEAPSDTSSVSSAPSTPSIAKTTTLRASAQEWKPSAPVATAATVTPSPVPAAPVNPNSETHYQKKNRSYKSKGGNNYQGGGGGFDPGYGGHNPAVYNYEQMQMYQQPYQDMSGAFMGVVPFDPNLGYYPPPQYFPNYDQPYGMPMPYGVMMVPEQMMMPPAPQAYYHHHTEVVSGMDNGGNAGMLVAPGLGDVGIGEAPQEE